MTTHAAWPANKDKRIACELIFQSRYQGATSFVYDNFLFVRRPNLVNIIIPIQLCIVYTFGTQWCWIKLPKGKAGALGFKNNSRNKVFLHKQLLYIVYISISNDIGDIHGRWSQSVNTVNNGSGMWFRWERRLLSELLQTLPGDSLSQSCLLLYFCTSSCSPV